jgi:hypothetical protein
MSFNFESYIKAFNGLDGTEESLVSEYFTDDMRLEGPDGSHDKVGWIGILKHAHRGVKETLMPISVVREGNIIMAEIDASFSAGMATYLTHSASPLGSTSSIIFGILSLNLNSRPHWHPPSQ